MPSHAYNNLPPPASTYQTPSKQQPQLYQSQPQPQNQNQNQIYQNQPSSYQLQNQSSPNQQKPLPPIPIIYTQTPQYKVWCKHVLALYHRESHEKYFRWSEEEIAVDIAFQCFIDGVCMDCISDAEAHAVEVCLVFVEHGVWRFCGARADRVREIVRASM